MVFVKIEAETAEKEAFVCSEFRKEELCLKWIWNWKMYGMFFVLWQYHVLLWVVGFCCYNPLDANKTVRFMKIQKGSLQLEKEKDINNPGMEAISSFTYTGWFL